MNEFLTPCILQTIIICCTIITLGIIGVVAYGIKKRGPRDWASYVFTASIFLTIGIAIFSLCYCGDKNVLDFMSLASAIISIILAILTIIYSYYTNGTTSSSVDKMGEASKKMEGTLLKVNEATQSYKESADSLKNNITTLLNTIQHVDQTTNKLLESQELNNKPNTKDLKDGLNDKMVNNFIELSSPRGNVLMYACIKACDKNVVLMLENIMEDNSLDYCRGFLIAAKSAGLFKLKIWADRSKGIEIIEYHPILKKALLEYCANTKTQFYTSMIKKIDSLFE